MMTFIDNSGVLFITKVAFLILYFEVFCRSCILLYTNSKNSKLTSENTIINVDYGQAVSHDIVVSRPNPG